MINNPKRRVCSRCVMDDSDAHITFDKNGVCNLCRNALDWKKRLIPNKVDIDSKLKYVFDFIKEKQKNMRYDCIIGLSGGLDSSYALLKAKELGLRILAVHVDAGWNNEIAVKNIETLVKSLDVDLYTYVVEWKEMKELQKAFFFSGVVNCDTPQDHAYFSALMQVASKYSIKYIITGQNWQSESILASSWEWHHMDGYQVKDIYYKYTGKKFKSYPILNVWKYLFYFTFIKNMKYIRILDFLNYNTQKAKSELEEIGWKSYGGKHNESHFTKFYQNYYLPKRLGFDKRIAHLSSLIISGEITRDEALDILSIPLGETAIKKEELDYILSKLELTKEEWEKIINLPVKSYKEYKNFEKLLNFRNRLLKWIPRYSYIAPGYKKEMLE